MGFSPEYVLDKIKIYEVNVILSNIGRCQKLEWERTRMIAYTIAQVNSTKKIKLTDILKFDWDKATDDLERKMSTADKKRLQEKAREYSKTLQNG